MVKKSDIESLYDQIKRIPTTQSNGTLTGASMAYGESSMKLKVIELMRDWYSTCSTRGTHGA